MHDVCEIEDRLYKELDRISEEMNRDATIAIDASLLERLDKISDILKDLHKSKYYEMMCVKCCENTESTAAVHGREAVLKELDRMMSTIGSEKEREAIMKCFNELKRM